jgi:phosphoserine phosphatase RsbU/P
MTERPAGPDLVAGHADADGTRATILVAEDNETSRAILLRILDRPGWKVVAARDGNEALALARTTAPDVVLLDVRMPGRSGFDVCEQLVAEAARPEAFAVIFLSALSDPADRIEGLRRGAVDFVSKPFDTAEILARIETHVRLLRLRRDLERANDELRRKEAALTADLRAAAEIQASLLPAAVPAVAGIAIAWRFLPSDHVGGDLFHVGAVDGRNVTAWLLDVSGHGVPAAMVAAAAAQALAPGELAALAAAGGAAAPADVLRLLDARFPLERFERPFTIAYLTIDAATGRVRFSRAGHPPPLVLRRDGRIEELAAGGSLIGLGSGVPFAEDATTLAPGERIVLYSDGLVEAADTSGEVFGVARLRAVLRDTADRQLDEVCGEIVARAAAFIHTARFADDCTILALEREAAAPDSLADDAVAGGAPASALDLAIPARTRDVALAAAALRGVLADLQVEADLASRIETAVVEAINNAVLHAYGGRTGGRVELGVRLSGGSLVVEVTDRGPPFVPPPESAVPRALSESGRGWPIMRAWMDEVNVVRRDGRNVVRLVKRLGPRAAN